MDPRSSPGPWMGPRPSQAPGWTLDHHQAPGWALGHHKAPGWTLDHLQTPGWTLDYRPLDGTLYFLQAPRSSTGPWIMPCLQCLPLCFFRQMRSPCLRGPMTSFCTIIPLTAQTSPQSSLQASGWMKYIREIPIGI